MSYPPSPAGPSMEPLYPTLGTSDPSQSVDIGYQPGPSFQSPGLPFAIPTGATSSLATSAITQIGFDYGRDFIGKGWLQYNKTFTMLKFYFTVNNSYVINKLKVLLFPFRHKNWKRSPRRQAEGLVYPPPKEDINAPDLYLPTMAFITYVLLIGYVRGAAFEFTPEVLGMTASKGLFTIMLELALLKFGFYLFNAFSVPLLDLIAYSGYKFVGAVLTVIGGFVMSSYIYWAVFFFTSFCMAVFMVKTLKIAFPESQGFGVERGTNRRNYFLLAVGGLQFLLNFYLTISAI